MRKWILYACMMCMVLTGCRPTSHMDAIPQVPVDKEVTIMQATDLHYLSPTLFDEGETFTKLMNTNDGKVTTHSKQILDALVQEVIDKKPSVFILSGDITFNGELISLKEVRTALRKIKEAGIPVLVVPGNHDINYIFSYSYHGDKAKPTENISQEEFQSLMKEFGYDQAMARDDKSFSYVIQISDHLRIMAIDGNTTMNIGTVLPETIDWMGTQLQDAKDNNAQVITFSHQNVLKQSELLYDGFIFDNASKVRTLLQKYDVHLNLSGHSHLMHESTDKELTDICTGALSLYPLRYGWVSVQPDGQWQYTKKHLNLLQDESRKEFKKVIIRQVGATLEDYDIPVKDMQEMLDFAIAFNISFFTQENYDPKQLLSQNGFTLWQMYASDTMWFTYMNTALHESN